MAFHIILAITLLSQLDFWGKTNTGSSNTLELLLVQGVNFLFVHPLIIMVLSTILTIKFNTSLDPVDVFCCSNPVFPGFVMECFLFTIVVEKAYIGHKHNRILQFILIFIFQLVGKLRSECMVQRTEAEMVRGLLKNTTVASRQCWGLNP